MNTPFILNTVASTQQAARPATMADSFSADVPFNQVLNKEVSNRNNDNRDKPRDVVKQATPDQVKTGTPVASNQTPATAQPAQPAKSSDKDVAKKTDDDEDGDNDSATAASAQLLALVANLEQMPARPDVKDSAAQAALAAQLAAKTVGKIDPAAAKPAADGIEAAGDDDGKQQKPDFAGLLTGKEKTTEKPQAEAAVTEHPAAAAAKKPAEPALTNAKPVAAQDNAVATAPRQTEVKPVAELPLKTQEAAPIVPVATTPALQQAMAMSQAAQASAMTKLAPPVGSQGWDQALGQKIVWMASGAQQSATLTLNPPDLGPLQVVLHVTNSQADAAFMTAQPEVKQALEAAMPKLREMLDQAGIQLGQATVSTGTPNQQQHAGNQTQGHSGRNTGAGPDSDIALTAAPATPITSSGQGLVDTFA